MFNFFRKYYEERVSSKVIFVTNGDRDHEGGELDKLTGVGIKQVSTVASKLLQRGLKPQAILYASGTKPAADILFEEFRNAGKQVKRIERDEYLDSDRTVPFVLASLSNKTEKTVIVIGYRSEIAPVVERLTGKPIQVQSAHAIVVNSRSNDWVKTAASKANKIKMQFIAG